MNEANYASLEASKRLAEAGILLETEVAWFPMPNGWELLPPDVFKHTSCSVPAPSMAEVWRELPEEIDGSFLEVWKHHTRNESGVSYTIPADGYDDSPEEVISFTNTNPTDALIDLLIWQRKEASHDRD